MAAIMFTDMVGYTALGQRNEALSLALVEEQRKLIRPILVRHHGKEIKTIGDAFLVEFPNALDAVRCAYDIQRATREFNVSLPIDEKLHLRVGVHLGDVVESNGDVSGDAINIASRIEPLADDGGVCVSHPVFEQVENKIEIPLRSIGKMSLKNVLTPLELYKMEMPWGGDVKAPKLDTHRVAILPFVNMSTDPNDAYFADGITEELISAISNISGLDVISRTSIMKFRGGVKTAKEVGQELDAGVLLEGSVRKADNFVRVTAQLIDVNADRHLWSQNYDRELKSIFALQSDIAKQVAEALRVRLDPREMNRIEKKATENSNAYTLYLKGRYLWNRKGLEDLNLAKELFEQAIREDPSFALGYVGAADCYMSLRWTWGIDSEANLERTRAMVSKALELDPDLAEAHATKGRIFREEYNLRQADGEFKKSIELKPSYAMAHLWRHLVYFPQLRFAEALEELQKALELDPLSPVINAVIGQFYSYKKDYTRAIDFLKKSIELGAGPTSHGFISLVYGKLKMYDDMKREREIFLAQIQGSSLSERTREIREALEAYLKNDPQTVRALLPELETSVEYEDAYTFASLHFYLGEIDKGFEWLERSYSSRESELLNIKADEDFDLVRNDPRYFDLIKRLGLV